MTSAVVVGAGPNGLTGAALLAKAGVEVTVIEAAREIGGGTRSSELTLPGLLHDHCSATHPMGVISPAFAELELERHGLEWLWSEVELAHPLDGGRAAAMYRSIEDTAAGLGPDGRAWQRLFGPSSRLFGELFEADLARPVVHLPRHPLALLRFGIPSLAPVSLLGRVFETEEAKALFAGTAAHAFSRFDWPLSAAIGMALISAGHHRGWPVARGGSAAIARALAAVIESHGGRIETGNRVRSLAELPRADVVLLDLAPRAVAELAGSRLPDQVGRAYRRYRHGPGAFKLDLAVEGGVPWAAEACRRAGTVHVGGTLAEIGAAERDVNRGRMPERPFILVGQQYLADPGRSAGNVHPVWAYAHVPHGYPGDAGEAILDQLERFAPGLRERIVARSSRHATEWEAYNHNLIGGDIVNGANTPRQMIFRPRVTLRPYDTGIPGVYLCSAATPPGGGVHGLCGAAAAARALAHLKRA